MRPKGKDSRPTENNPTSNADSSATSIPDRLWDGAYDSLKTGEAKLLHYFEKIPSKELVKAKDDDENVINQKDPKKRRSQMDELLEVGLEKTEALAKAESNIGSTVKVVLSVKDAIGSALQPVVIAALAWTGVSFALLVCYVPERLLLLLINYIGNLEPCERDKVKSGRD
jgi:hypothetical protein